MSEKELLQKQISPYAVVAMALTSVLTAVLFLAIFVFKPAQQSEPDVLGVLVDNSDVTVTVSIQSCFLEVTVHPEKRIPVTNNWQTEVEGEIYDLANNYITTVTGFSNSAGVATFDMCGQGDILPAGDYKFWIKGLSHLRKDFGTKEAFETAVSSIDFTPDGLLLAGETSIIFDNFINVLDISTQIGAYGSGDNKNDLNQDGVVNILDISNTITNLYIEGECSPEDQSAGACPF